MFDRWLDSEANKALEKFKNNENLSIEDKMILTLKAQTNHFTHLDQDIKDRVINLETDMNQRFERLETDMNQRFEKVDERFEKVDNELKEIRKELSKIYSAINNQTWKMLGGLGLLAVFIKLVDNLPAIIQFFQK